MAKKLLQRLAKTSCSIKKKFPQMCICCRWVFVPVAVYTANPFIFFCGWSSQPFPPFHKPYNNTINYFAAVPASLHATRQYHSHEHIQAVDVSRVSNLGSKFNAYP